MRELKIGVNEAGQRLDKYLAKYMSEAPKSFFYKNLRKKNITVNKKKCDGSEKLMQGDVVYLFLAEETIESFRPQKQVKKAPVKQVKLDIVYEDDHVLLINKPQGMLSQKAKQTDESLVEYLIDYLMRKKAVDEESLRSFRPSVCNRLDRNTSGLVTAGKTLPGLQGLSELLRDRTVEKYYLALVKGKIREKKRIHGWIKKDEAVNKVTILSEKQENADEIHTGYEPIGYGENTTLLKVELITGKSHQIRAHLASIGHPIAGDSKYGDAAFNALFRDQYRIHYQLLHSWKMVFPKLSGELSGLSGKTITAPIPGYFDRILKAEHVRLLPEEGRKS